jgi:hypothetical protein
MRLGCDRPNCCFAPELPTGDARRHPTQRPEATSAGRFFAFEQRLRGDLTAAQLRLRFLLEKCLTNAALCYMLAPLEART